MGKTFVAGKGYIESAGGDDRATTAAAPPAEDRAPSPADAEDAYQAEREAAQHMRIGMSMDRMLGRRATDLPGRRLARQYFGDEFTRADSEYEVLRR
jgi:hypothetical protein